MAMNKKELAMVQALRERAALHWTVEVAPDLPPPGLGNIGVSQGWDYNEHTLEVYPAWSNSIYHSRGIHTERRSESARQNPKPLYSTEVLALHAMRHVLERKFAAKLASIDARIESARAAASQ